MERRGANPFKAPEPISGQYDATYRAADARRWAAYYGVPFRETSSLPADPSLLPRACLAANAQNAMIAMCHAIFRILFADGIRIDETLLEELAVDLGLDGRRFSAALQEPAIATRHDQLIGEAIARGVFGVPTFCLGDQMFWGNDRLVLLEAALRGIPMP